MAKIESIFSGCNRNLGIFDYNENLKIVAYGSRNTVSVSTPILLSSGYNPNSQVFTTLKNHTGEVTAVKWIQVTNMLLSGSQDGIVNIWKFDNIGNESKLFQSLKPTSSSISCIGIVSNDDNCLNIALADTNGGLFIYSFESEANKFTEIAQFQLPYGFYAMSLNMVKISNTEFVLFVGGSKPVINILTLDTKVDSDSKIKLETSLPGHDDWVRSIAVRQLTTTMETVDGITYPKRTYIVASGSLDRIIRLWKLTVEDSNTPVYIETNKLKLLTSKEYKFETKTNRCCIFLDAILMGHDDWVSEVSWKPKLGDKSKEQNENDLMLLSSSADSSIMMWKSDPISGIWFPEVRLGEMAIKGASTATGSSGGFYCSKWIFDEESNTELVLSNGKTGSFRCWVKDENLENVYNSRVSFTGAIRDITDISWSPNGDYVLVTSLDQSTRLYAKWGNDGKWFEFGRPQIHGFDMITVRCINGTRFVSGGDEKVIRVFDMPRSIADMLARVCKLKDFESGLLDEKLPESASLPVLGLSNKAELDNTNDTTKLNNSEMGNSNNDESGNNNISNNIMKDLQEPPVEDILQRHTLWPEIEKLYGHGFEITTLDVSNDGKLIASACRSNVSKHAVIRNFSTDTWLECDQKLEGHDLTITRLRFSLKNNQSLNNDEYLLSVSRDRKFTLWRRNGGIGDKLELVKIMEKAHTRIIWDCAWVNFKDTVAFVTCSRDKEVKLWIMEGDEVVCKGNVKFDVAVTAIDSIMINNNEGKFKLVIGLDNGDVYVYQVDVIHCEFEELEKIDDKLLPGDSISRISIKPIVDSYGKIIAAVGSRDHSIRIFNI